MFFFQPGGLLHRFNCILVALKRVHSKPPKHFVNTKGFYNLNAVFININTVIININRNTAFTGKESLLQPWLVYFLD